MDDATLDIEKAEAILQTKPKKGKAADEGKVKTKSLYTHITLGGANKQNITIFGGAAKSAYLFSAPQPGVTSKNVYRFLFRSWVPYINASDWSLVEKGVKASINNNFGTSLSNIYIESKNQGLIEVAQKCHNQAVDLSRDLAEAVVTTDANGKIVTEKHNPGEAVDNRDGNNGTEETMDRTLDESVLATNRSNGAVSALDKAILSGGFGSEYREALAVIIARKLEYYANRDPRNQVIHQAQDKIRLVRAIAEILEGVTR
jgi:hypothetical protein